MTEPVKCRRGHRVFVRWMDFGGWRVQCSHADRRLGYPFTCWIGPICRTRTGAIRAWNAVMARKEK